eukprot:TRINITY_DN11773_c0_g1_i1.p1 TRINITY_DN11773_c0_g1~~TRINITY_DN11773_c0_g1_i1.p1  ORF type:complete len:278 (+),score=71.81 TRINITY_DN11773_c0_g1_i1:48-881(+)
MTFTIKRCILLLCLLASYAFGKATAEGKSKANPAGYCTKEGCFKARSMRERVRKEREQDKASEHHLQRKRNKALEREMRKARFKKHEWLKSLKDISSSLQATKRSATTQEMSFPKDIHPAAQKIRAEMEETMEHMNVNNMSVSSEVIEKYRRDVVVVAALIKEENKRKLEQSYEARKKAAISRDPPSPQERAAIKAKLQELTKLRQVETLEKAKLDKDMKYRESLKTKANKRKVPNYTDEERASIRQKMAADLQNQRQKGTASPFSYPPGHPKGAKP